MQREAFNFSSYCKFPAMILAFCWLFGLSIGTAYALSTIDSVFFLMRMFPFQHVSIVTLVVELFFVFVIYFAACRLISRIYIYVLAVMKALIFSYCMVCINLVYGSAGWLIYFLVSFTVIVTLVPYIWFSLCAFRGTDNCLKRNLIVCLIYDITVFVTDAYFVSPYLAYIMTLI